MKMKEEKAKEKAAADEQARLEALERENNFEGWSGKLKSEHEVRSDLYKPPVRCIEEHSADNYGQNEGAGQTQG